MSRFDHVSRRSSAIVCTFFTAHERLQSKQFNEHKLFRNSNVHVVAAMRTCPGVLQVPALTYKIMCTVLLDDGNVFAARGIVVYNQEHGMKHMGVKGQVVNSTASIQGSTAPNSSTHIFFRIFSLRLCLKTTSQNQPQGLRFQSRTTTDHFSCRGRNRK